MEYPEDFLTEAKEVTGPPRPHGLYHGLYHETGGSILERFLMAQLFDGPSDPAWPNFLGCPICPMLLLLL